MIARRSVATCIIAVFAVLAALIATPFIQTAAAQAATIPDYGAGAYTGSNAIGGGNGYVSAHGYSQASADYVVTTWAQLKSACSSAGSGDVIWVPNGTTLTMASADDHPTLKPGVVLASNRGQNGATGGKLKQPYISSGSGNYMSPVIYASSNCVISGLTFEGPGCFASTNDARTNAAIRIDNAKRVEIENCEIKNFYQGGIYIRGGMPSPWNSDTSTGRHWIHHCTIHGMQRHGFGYGIQVESGGSFLCEACNLYDCRHEICASQTAAGGSGNCYEIRYCTIGDGWYRSMGTGAPTGNHAVDVHGYGASTSGYAGGHILVHHNTFTANSTYSYKANVGVRGIPQYECRVYHNWTKKTNHSGLYSETSPNSAFTLLASGGTAWNGGSTMSNYKMYVYDNWYGTSSPSGSSASTNSGSSTPTNTTPTSTAVSAPTLAAPANGAVTTDHTPYLDWSQVTAASTVHYQVQVDNNSDFSSPVVSKTWVSYSYYYVTTSLSHTTYYWRVRAVDAAGKTSAWTSARSFRVA